MALSFGSSKEDDVATLIAKKQYAKAIESIRAQLKSGRPDPRLKLQLADALVAAGRDREAVMILLQLADEYATEGFAAKAISVLKKIQKLDPGRRDIEAKLAALIETKQRLASTMPFVPPAGMPEIGMEEIGFDPLPGGPLAVPAVAPAPRPAGDELTFGTPPVVGPDLDLGPDLSPPRARPAPVRRAPVADLDLSGGDDASSMPFFGGDAQPVADDGGAEFSLEDAEPILDGEVLELEPADAEPPRAAGAGRATPSVDAAFTDELLSMIDGLFPSGAAGPFEAPVDEAHASGTQIVVSPLFKDFSVDETVAVIQGLRLLTVEPRKVILRQGEPGNSLYMLTSGRVRAFVRNPDGKQAPIADLEEGAFFGEMSILTGKPRNATIVAVERSELLELDRATLDGIVASHPHVWDVLREFAQQRSQRR